MRQEKLVFVYRFGILELDYDYNKKKSDFPELYKLNIEFCLSSHAYPKIVGKLSHADKKTVFISVFSDKSDIRKLA